MYTRVVDDGGNNFFSHLTLLAQLCIISFCCSLYAFVMSPKTTFTIISRDFIFFTTPHVYSFSLSFLKLRHFTTLKRGCCRTYIRIYVFYTMGIFFFFTRGYALILWWLCEKKELWCLIKKSIFSICGEFCQNIFSSLTATSISSHFLLLLLFLLRPKNFFLLSSQNVYKIFLILNFALYNFFFEQ